MLANNTDWLTTFIGVNAAGVAGVATPPVFALQGSSYVDDPPIFWEVFYFFPFSGTWNGFASLYRSLGTNWYFYKVYHTMGHMNLKNNTPRMHHITPFWDEKFKFSGKGHNPSPYPPPSPPTEPRFSRLRRSTCDPPIFQCRWRPWLDCTVIVAVCCSTSVEWTFPTTYVEHWNCTSSHALRLWIVRLLTRLLVNRPQTVDNSAAAAAVKQTAASVVRWLRYVNATLPVPLLCPWFHVSLQSQSRYQVKSYNFMLRNS